MGHTAEVGVLFSFERVDRGGNFAELIPKAEHRRRLLAIRAALSPEARAAGSALAVDALIQSGLLVGVQTLALFSAFGDEADPRALEAEVPQVAYPRIEAKGLVFHRARRAELVPGRAFGILEPLSGAPVAPLEAIDLYIVPGLGFGRRGERLGYGRGYYDRALSAAKTLRPGVLALGFAFTEQVVEGIEMTADDHWLDGILTPDGLLHPSPG